ncbi:MAG: hypothetical protein ACKERG_03715 [Candidatus Hodgkinia cicadicola]
MFSSVKGCGRVRCAVCGSWCLSWQLTLRLLNSGVSKCVWGDDLPHTPSLNGVSVTVVKAELWGHEHSWARSFPVRGKG